MSAVEQATPSQKWVGQAMRRKEDARMITGRGNYVDDLVLSGMLYMAVVRSTEAHAKITSIDTAAAKEAAGVHGVFTAEDLKLEAPIPMVWIPPGVEIKTPETWPLAKGVVKYVGQPVAVVVGSDKYGVVDAAEQVVVEYDPLPVVVDPEKALESGSPLVHEEFGTNQSHEWTIGGGDMDTAWSDADVVIERRIVNHRTAGTPIETRACVADFRAGALTRAPHEPEPAPRPPLHGRRARNVRGEDPHHRARRRRRLRREDHALPRGDHRRRRVARAGPAGQVDRDALGAHDVDDPRPRPDRLREGRRQARRHDHRPPVHGDLPTSARTSRR